jgi:hypothetical protein
LATPEFGLANFFASVLHAQAEDASGKLVRGDDLLAYLALVAAQRDVKPDEWFTVDYESLARLCWGPESRPTHWQRKIKAALATLGCYPEPTQGCPDSCGLHGAGTWHMHLLVRLPTDIRPLPPLVGPIGPARLAGTPLYVPLLLLGRSAGLSARSVRVLLSVLAEGFFDVAGRPVPRGHKHRFRFDGSRPLRGGYELGHRLQRAMLAPAGFCDQPLMRMNAMAFLAVLQQAERELGLRCVVTIRENRRSVTYALGLLQRREKIPAQAVAAWRLSISAAQGFFESLRSKLQTSSGVALYSDYSDDEAERNLESPRRRGGKASSPCPAADQEELRSRLRRYMDENGLTQAFIARQANTSQKTIWSFLRGDHKVRPATAKLLYRWLAAAGC